MNIAIYTLYALYFTVISRKHHFPTYRVTGVSARVCREQGNAYQISSLRPTTKTNLGATGFLSKAQPTSQPHHRLLISPFSFPPANVNHHVPSLDEHKHKHEHRRLAHPPLLARDVGSPLPLLPRGARPAPQEAPPPIAIHPRGPDPGRRAGGGGRPDAKREGLSLDHHCAAARSGAEEDSDAREGRG
jgi:hypothetical protein